jgi:flagellar hook assembly protein FlgD
MTTTVPPPHPLRRLNPRALACAPPPPTRPAADRFLKLLVTQMQNQDPLNPMDNAQITSQMAQINTVNGIEKLNTTVAGLNTSSCSCRRCRAPALVGRDVHRGQPC